MSERLESLTPQLLELSHTVHGLHETRFEEERSSSELVRLLEAHGFRVDRGLADMPTGFIARRGQGEPVVGFFAEYDALPDIGHACGHNIIAAASVGAGILLADWLETDGRSASVWVVGSPGEEGGGGKVKLLEAGVLDPLSVALMAHPAAVDEAAPAYLCREGIDVRFYGKEAHFAAAPEEGVNALSAVLLWFHFIDALRNHLDPASKVHGIITHGGTSPNVVPAFAAARMLVRGPETAITQAVLDKVLRAAESAATGTGCRMEWERFVPFYENVAQDEGLASLMGRALQERGRTPVAGGPPLGSTDMGNVSQRVPSLHINIGIGKGLVPHTREFAAAAIGPDGDAAVVDAAYALARTASLYLEEGGR